MKTTIFSALFATLLSTVAIAQDVTTVNATSSEISDNLDLRAVASIFGEAANLEDFERRLNDPKLQISNLDLNGDNQVDYIRVIESVEGNTHLIILQSVLARDVFQDVATIEVERDANNNVQVQVVGDVYMYGPNYIYEPVYVQRPIIYSHFWIGGYQPYYSNWYYGYYPSYYYAWNPYPVFRYRRNVHVHINVHNNYNYVNVRRSDRAVALYSGRRANGYERQYPNRSFQQRNANVANRYELDRTRKDVGVRNGLTANPRNAATRSNAKTETASVRNNPVKSTGNVRGENNTPRANTGTRSQTTTPRSNSAIRTETSPSSNNNSVRTRDNQSIKNQSMPRANNIRTQPVPSQIRTQTSVPSQTRTQSAPSQTRPQTSVPAQPRMQNAAPRAAQMQPASGNSAPRVQSQGNSGRGQQAAPAQRQGQSQGGRSAEGRR